MAIRDQGPLSKLTMWNNIIAPKDWGAKVDYDQDQWVLPVRGKVPAASPPAVFKNIYVHWGGGPNDAGEFKEEPVSTRKQKLAIQLGLCGSVVRSWESYHLSKGWRGIAYELLFDPRYGKILRGRGWAQGAGCYGHWNNEGLSFVFILGYGQFPTLSARRSFGRVMVELGNVKAMPHYATNFDTPSQYRTTCPGTSIGKWVEEMGWCDDLPVLRYRAENVKDKPMVRSVAKRLNDLGFAVNMDTSYDVEMRDAIAQFQANAGMQVDGICGPDTYRELHAAH